MGNPLDNLSQIAIIGTGLLGASIGQGLKAAGYTGRIVGIGRNAATLDKAKAVGAIDDASTDGAPVADSQLAIVAVPLGAFEKVFTELAPHVHDDLVVTDVGSTKSDVVAYAARLLPALGGRFVGSHPMAGSEQQGPEAADANLCQGKPCILTPTQDTDAAAQARVEELWQTLGMKLLYMSPEVHDRSTAAVSHLPHAAAVMLIRAAEKLGGFEVASTGFRDTTRLASSNPPMRSDIMLSNKKFLLESLATYRQQIDELSRLLEAGDETQLLNWLKQAQSVRDGWLTKYNGDANS